MSTIHDWVPEDRYLVCLSRQTLRKLTLTCKGYSIGAMEDTNNEDTHVLTHLKYIMTFSSCGMILNININQCG